MKYRTSLAAIATAFALICALPSPVTAQNPVLTNVIPEAAALTIHARITAMDPATRNVTLVGASGNTLNVVAGPNVRLEMLKVGDRVNAKYYRSVAFAVNPPTGGSLAPVSDDQMAQIMARQAEAPGGVGVRLTRVSGTVVGIDLAQNHIDVVNPSGGGIYTIDITDPARIAMLRTLKIGDTVTAVISQTLAVSIDPAASGLF